LCTSQEIGSEDYLRNESCVERDDKPYPTQLNSTHITGISVISMDNLQSTVVDCRLSIWGAQVLTPHLRSASVWKSSHIWTQPSFWP